MAEVKGLIVNVRKTKEFDFYIGRNAMEYGYLHKDAGTPNPFPIGGSVTRIGAVRAFEKYARAKLEIDPEYREKVKRLYGKVLGCWCAPALCHGEILLQLAAELQET